MTIERDSPIPLYYQLKELLGTRITSGQWAPGDMLPTEEQLQEQYAVSRSTVRQALRELELEGRIARHQGRGTFVSRRKISHGPEPRFSLTMALRQQGIEPGWRLLSADWLPASAEVAEQLALDPGTPVFTLRRLRLANDEPIGYHLAHVSPLAAHALDRARLDQGGSLDYLRGDGTLNDSTAERVIEAIPAPDDVARLLDTERGAPLLLIRRQVRAREGEVLELLQAMYRGDRFQYFIGAQLAP